MAGRFERIRQAQRKHRPGKIGPPGHVRKVSGDVVKLRCKRWHVLEVMAIAGGWTHIAELGVFTAPTTLHLLSTLKGIHLTAVDFYRVPQGNFGQDGFTHYGAPDMERLYQDVCEALKPFGERVRLLRMDTQEAAKHVKDNSQNAVFIDADHRTTSVIADMLTWRPKVKPGGWLMGHDWHWESVREAVLSIATPVLFPDHVWGIKC